MNMPRGHGGKKNWVTLAFGRWEANPVLSSRIY
jgi:hypothetical protein